VLKTRAQTGFYVGGNGLFFGSVNACFFGVNIAFSVFHPMRETLPKTLDDDFNN
jgi:hypothetical protein